MIVAIKIWLTSSVAWMLVASCALKDFFTHKTFLPQGCTDPDWEGKKDVAKFLLVYIPAMLGLFFFFRAGFGVLIPPSWGAANGDGEWVSVNAYLAGVSCFFFSWFLYATEKDRRVGGYGR